MNARTITAPDGRTLRVTVDDVIDGPPVLVLFGTPGSGEIPGQILDAARRAGARTISYDRPGYGSSTRHEGRNVADCAADVRAIATALGIDRLGLWGISGGGPHAIACAGLLTGLVPAVGVLASPAPYGAPKLDWMAGMGDDNVEEFSAVLQSPAAGRTWLEAARPAVLDADPQQTVEMMRTLLSPVDAAVFTGEVAAEISASMAVGLAGGVDGWLDDDLAFVRDWGFGLTQIRTPVLLIHGRQDRFVPVAHGEWLAGAIPDVEARILDDEGHLSLLENRLGDVYGWLLERIG